MVFQQIFHLSNGNPLIRHLCVKSGISSFWTNKSIYTANGSSFDFHAYQISLTSSNKLPSNSHENHQTQKLKMNERKKENRKKWEASRLFFFAGGFWTVVATSLGGSSASSATSPGLSSSASDSFLEQTEHSSSAASSWGCSSNARSTYLVP